MWRAVGGILGYRTPEQYLKSIPPIPTDLFPHDPDFPLVALAEPRIDLKRLCTAGGIGFAGDDTTLQAFDERHADSLEPVWIRFQSGERYRGRSMAEVRAEFSPNTRGLTALDGVCAIIQYPDIIEKDVRMMDLPGSIFRKFPSSTVYLRRTDAGPWLGWGWGNEETVPGFGSASRRV